MKQISHQEPWVDTSVTTTKATHTFSVTSAQISATGETFTVSAPTVQVKYNTNAGGRNGIADRIKLRPTVNNISKSDPAYHITEIPKALNYNTNLPMSLIDAISWSFNTADIFNANNPTVRTVSINWPYEINMMETGKMLDAYSMQVIGHLNMSGRDPIPITGTLSGEGSVTLNAPPTFDSPADVTLDIPVAYAGYTTATISVSNLSAKYGGDISSAVLKIGNATSSPRTTDGTLSLELTETGIFTPQVIVTDSRGQITTKNLAQITVLPYVLPSTSFSVIRTSSTGEAEDEGKSAVITATYNFTSAVASLQAPTIVIKDPSSVTLQPVVTWYTDRALTTPISDWSTVLTGSTVYALLDNANHDLFNTQYSYQIGITPNDIDVNSDTHSGTTITQILGSAFYTMDFLAGGHGIAFGKAATNEGFECDMETTFNDTVLFEDDIQAIGAATFSDTVLFEEDIEADEDIHLGLSDYQTTGSVDKELYDGLDALGWLSDCFANGKLKLKKTLSKALNKLKTINNDTGWISLIPYLNTGYAGRSTDSASWMCPAYRIYNNVVYFRGFIYSTTAKNSNAGTLCTNIPSAIRVSERGCGSVRFLGTAYHIRVESGNINVYDTTTIGVQAAHTGYHLACLSYVLGD